MADKKTPYFKKLNTEDKNLNIIQNNVEEVLKAISQQLVNLNGGPSGIPIGSTIAWDNGVEIPLGYLERKGQAVSRTDYAELFAKIGTRFGAGNGSTTFNIPNSQGLVLRHAGTQVVGGNIKDGGLLGEVIEDQMQRITGDTEVGGVVGISSTISQTGAFGLSATTKSQSINGTSNSGSPARLTFDSSDSPNARVSDTTAGETRASSISTIFIMKVQNLETASATAPAIDALNARVSTNESDILAIESQLPPPISAITGLGDFIKIGQDSRNDDGTYTVSFDTPFVSGSDSDIQIVIMRMESDTSNTILATNFTKSGFNVNRANDINGTQTISYIAINGSYL